MIFLTLCIMDVLPPGSAVSISSTKEAATIAKTMRSFSILSFFNERKNDEHIFKRINRIVNIQFYHFDFVLILETLKHLIRPMVFGGVNDPMAFGHDDLNPFRVKTFCVPIVIVNYTSI